jgi:6-phosphofructokinase 2
MCKIVTITFSPCIDKSTSVPSLIPEKKLVCSTPTLAAGGGGINVSRALNKLGGRSIAIFPSGGYTGKYFNHLLQQDNIPSVIIETVNETRENIIVYEEKSNSQFRFGMPGAPMSETECMQCLDAVSNIEEIEYLVASGSLPPGIPKDIYGQLALIAKKKNARFIVDSAGAPLQLALEQGVYLCKPNRHELAFLVGRTEMQLEEIKLIAKQIIDTRKSSIVLVSLGAEGAILVTADISIQIRPPVVETKSTVGAGDSMLAGVLLYLSKGKTVLEAAQYGVACGTAASLYLGTELCNKVAADKLFATIHADWIYSL